jgi:hypothetical protein
METLPLFYSLNRYLEHEGHIGAGSVEICRATFVLDARKKEEGKENLISVEGKLCEESMRLTAFHTPDGIYCWNRLLMGAKPSSAVQQSAYLETLDDFIDYYEDGTL